MSDPISPANIQQQIHESLLILSALIILNGCRGRHMWLAQGTPKCTICPKRRRVGAAAIDPQFPRTYVIRRTLPPGNHYKQIRRRFCRRQRRNSCSKWRPFFRDQTPGQKRSLEQSTCNMQSSKIKLYIPVLHEIRIISIICFASCRHVTHQKCSTIHLSNELQTTAALEKREMRRHLLLERASGRRRNVL